MEYFMTKDLLLRNTRFWRSQRRMLLIKTSRRIELPQVLFVEGQDVQYSDANIGHISILPVEIWLKKYWSCFCLHKLYYLLTYAVSQASNHSVSTSQRFFINSSKSNHINWFNFQATWVCTRRTKRYASK